jgi:AraC-like DNA-binding protein|tara:strand:+ start:111 stop:953 length:843 start_codon:yes stop_codon:yes gene_type:complete
MILKRKSIDYDGETIIEKVILKPPFRIKQLFSNHSCFIYTKGVSQNIISGYTKNTINSDEAVVLSCGSYLLDWIQTYKSNNESVEVFALHFYPHLIKKIYENNIPVRSVSNGAIRINKNELITQFIDSLEFYFNNPDIITNEIIELKIRELIALLIQVEPSGKIDQIIFENYTGIEVNFKRIIEANLYSNISIEEYAFLANLSLSQFKLKFNQLFNESPRKHINRRRIEKGKVLIENTDLNIGEIAQEVGYDDQNYFTRLFKKKEGLTPLDYKKLKKTTK